MKMKMKLFLVMVLGVSVIGGGAAFAGSIDWSKSNASPVSADTVRVYGLIYSSSPGVTSTYNVDFKFNETTLTFAPVLPTSLVSINESKYATADALRGGLLYDKWWKVNGKAEPTGNHPRYPAAGKQSGADTWRCKECHGWDNKGKDGAYSSGSHLTGIKGVYEARNMNAANIFARITEHNISSLSEQDIWDLSKFIKEALVEMDKYINFSGAKKKSATGDATLGKTLFENTGTGGGQCIMCHGADGTAIKFDGTDAIGDVANDNSWEVLQKIRFGHPGSTSMPSAVKNGLSITDQINILTYAQTLRKLVP